MPSTHALLALVLLLLGACGDGAKREPDERYLKASCTVDEECAKDRVCQKGADGKGTCEKGERSATAKADKEKAAMEARKAKEAEKKQTKPGEGRLTMRVCPVFKNTPEAIGTLVAKNLETNKESYIHMAQVVPDGQWEDEFTFWSLPPGKYEVVASYGIQIHGRAEVVKIKCHEKVKKDECKDEVVRLVEVLPLDKQPPPEVDKEGKPVKKPCDWLAE